MLARTSLVPSNIETYNVAFEHLSRATQLLSLPPSSSTDAENASYIRCVSGAFHNLAGTLYQAGKYAGAVRFLKEGCSLGREALVARGEDGERSEAWKQLWEQLYRRWELLGVCHSKMGDRRVSSDFYRL